MNRENIFVEERNYDLFLRLFEKHIRPVTDLFAYCLLKNQFHLLIRTKPLRVPRKSLKVSLPGLGHEMQDTIPDLDDQAR